MLSACLDTLGFSGIVGCAQDSDCDGRERCIDSECRIGCVDDSECPETSQCSFFTCTQTAPNQTFDVDSEVNETTDLSPLADSTTETGTDTDADLMLVVPTDAEQPPIDASAGTDVLDSTSESLDGSIQSLDAF